MTKRKHPRGREAHPEVLTWRPWLMVESHRSSPLGQLQLYADDFNPGSHLEVGDLKAMDVSLGATRRRLGDLPTRDRESGRAALAATRLEISIPKIDGVSEYPVPVYPEQTWERTMPDSVRTKRVPMRCATCGDRLTTVNPKARTCSSACRQWAYNARQRAARNGDIVVYFIATRDRRYVKIGVTSFSVERRLTHIQVSNPEPLTILAVIKAADSTTEASWHTKWHHLNVRGEWFQLTPELLKDIESI